MLGEVKYKKELTLRRWEKKGLLNGEKNVSVCILQLIQCRLKLTQFSGFSWEVG